MSEQHNQPSSGTPRGTESPQTLTLGPFTLREAIVGGLSVLIFAFSFGSVISAPAFFAFGAGLSVWSLGLLWVLAVALPLTAGVLLILRRLVPASPKWVGSLSVDQFASVAFSVAATTWFTLLLLISRIASESLGQPFVELGVSWIVWVQVILAAAGVFFTVGAPFVPPFRAEFDARVTGVQSRAAREPIAVVQTPRERAEDAPPPSGDAWNEPPQTPPPSTTAANSTTTAHAGAAFAAEAAQPGAETPFREPASTDNAAPQTTESSTREDTPSSAPVTETDEPDRASATPDITQEPAADQRDASSSEADAAQHDSAAQVGHEDGWRNDPPAESSAEELQGDHEVEADHSDRAGNHAAEAVGIDELSQTPAESAHAEHDATADDPEPAHTADVTATDQPHESAPSVSAPSQPFWALAPEERTVHDAQGHPLFSIGPTAWALVLEDRGEHLVIRHDDGRIGYLWSVQGLTKG